MLLDEVALERSTYVVRTTFRDHRGDVFEPDTLAWTLRDGAGDVVNSRSNVVIENPESTEEIRLSGADLLKRTTLPRELRFLTLSGTYSEGLTFVEEIRFYVGNVV